MATMVRNTAEADVPSFGAMDTIAAMATARGEAGAPRLPFGLAVGVTGHRIAAVGRASIEATKARIASVFELLAVTADTLHRRNAAAFDQAPARYRLVSPLADGADQLAARLAVARGWALDVVLPFAHEDYCDDFSDPSDCALYHQLRDGAAAVLELPGTRANPLDAYVAAGRAVVAHTDVVVAVWNGEAARGRGGTAEIVEHALRRGLPVIHVPIDPTEAVRVLWTGFNDPPLDVLDFCDAPVRDLDANSADLVLTALLAPPADPTERGFIEAFHAERERRWRWRCEYPALLGLLGIKRLRLGVVRVAPYAEATRAEWTGFTDGCAEARHRVAGGFEPLEAAYRWADKLAEHHAMAYRSGHVLNFVFAAFAVVLALSGLFLPDLKPLLVAAELGVILTLVVNTGVGTRRGWHRRWLDYRSLAEQLRPMRSMKLAALARPPASPRRGARRWIDWYAAGWWRQMGVPDGMLDCDAVARLARLIVTEELRPQIAYHRLNAQRMHRLEHRLHRIADIFFALTVAGLVLFLCIYFGLGHEVAHHYALYLVAATAGFPAIGAALHGIREQGEFVRTAARSAATAAELEKLAGDLAVVPIGLPRAKSLIEEAARVMLADVGEWRMAYEMRKLAIPA